MESLEKRYESTVKALATLEREISLLQNPKYADIYETIRNSIIQAFEFSIDTFWKFIKTYLQEKHGITFDVISPKSILKGALEANIISKEELEILFNAINDRNITSHTYNEELAEKIVPHMLKYSNTMHTILSKIGNIL